jgi:hypothetical protein
MRWFYSVHCFHQIKELANMSNWSKPKNDFERRIDVVLRTHGMKWDAPLLYNVLPSGCEVVGRFESVHYALESQYPVVSGLSMAVREISPVVYDNKILKSGEKLSDFKKRMGV